MTAMQTDAVFSLYIIMYNNILRFYDIQMRIGTIIITRQQVDLYE